MPKRRNLKPRDQYVVPAVEQAVRVLLCLARSEGTHMSLTEISAQSGLHMSRTFSLLHTLQKFSFAQKNVGGQGYSLGLGLIELSRKVLDSLNVSRLAEPILKKIALASNSTALLGFIINEDELIIAGKYESGKDIELNVRVGRRFPISHSAEGKAIAAFLPENHLSKLLQKEKLYFYENPERFDKAQLAAELKECQRLGYAIDMGDIKQHGFKSIAAPIIDHQRHAIGFIGVIGCLPSERASEFGKIVSTAGKTLSAQIGAKEV